MHKRIHIALGLISGSLIAFQIVLMQILSITQWHHFAFMIISLALLGFGASGTVLSLFKNWFIDRKEIVLQLSILLSGVLIAITVPLSQFDFFRFDTFLLFADAQHIPKLIFTYLLLFMPFFTGALGIGLTFVVYSKEIGKLYFSNLVGSGLGGLSVLIILSLAEPIKAPIIISIFPLIGGLILHSKKNKIFVTVVEVFLIIVVFVGFFISSELHTSQYKSISKTLDLPSAEVVLEKNSPHGFIQVVESDALRYAPGLSLKFTGEIPVRKAVFSNGNWIGPVLSSNVGDSTFVLDFTTDGLIYKLIEPGKALILKSGTGEDVIHAKNHGTKNITAVEPNGALNSLLLNELAGATDSIYHQKEIKLIELSPRTFLQSNKESYDIIKLPTLGAFGGTSGTGAINEEYLLTTESFGLVFDRLTDEGYFTITTWLDYPYRNPLRLLATILESLKHKNISNPAEHMISIRSWSTITFFIKKAKLDETDVSSVRNFCDKMNFDVALLPGIAEEERTKYNQLQDDKFFSYIDTLFTTGKNNFINDYTFRIYPPTDNKPYFSQFLRWNNLSDIEEYFGSQSIPFFELGYLIVIITFIQILVFSFALIILPLFKLGMRGGNKLWTILYFSGLGIGYMFIEIVFIQKFVLYFGSPIYSASAVISFMLICSGVGSFLSTYISSKSKNLFLLLGGVIFLLLIYTFILDPILNATLGYSLLIKVIITFVIIGAPAFLMGFPFPLGIKKLGGSFEEQIPWAWGINGCFSVISTALATIISIELGFFAVFIFAAVAYGIVVGVSFFN
ncbi:MAG: hypothetical protein U5K00_18470 [Melioribacteraceae bacterium]|nr:hypothetical protein [Melioribacteraceae bacterium]